MLNGKSILITGGTGSFGRAFVSTVLRRYPDIDRLVIFSRDEFKQYEMSRIYCPSVYKCLRYFLGDVRDYDRLTQALQGVDIVIHAAALKQVPAAEYNPFEFVKTNVIGAENIARASTVAGVSKVLALSTDKAAAPANLYGATKLCSDKLFVAANNIRGKQPIRYSVVRYGNVFGSRGSVVPLFLEQARTGVLRITHPDMTRFSITLQEGVDTVLWTLENMQGGEIVVPKLPSYRVLDLASAIAADAKIDIVGIRPGEKLHEEMLTSSDSFGTIMLDSHYVIVPIDHLNLKNYYVNDFAGHQVPPGFSYNSNDNPVFLTVSQLKRLVIGGQ